MTELCDLARKWTTDKALYYTPTYDALFKDRRESVKKVLEFGIGYPELMMQPASRTGARYYIAGASLFMWEEYFPNAEIYALDRKQEIFVNSGRIQSSYCDQADEKTFLNAGQEIGCDFDIIIDDGSHRRGDQIRTAQYFYDFLTGDGIYIVEDAPPHDNEFLQHLPGKCTPYDFDQNPKDPARIVVIRR